MPKHFRFDKKLPKDGQSILAFHPSTKEWRSGFFRAPRPGSNDDNVFGNTVSFDGGGGMPTINNKEWDPGFIRVKFWMKLPPKPR